MTARLVFPLLLAFLTTACGPSFRTLYEQRLIAANPGHAPSAVTEPALRATWMGTAGLYLTDGETGLLIDPFVSRFGLFRIGLGFGIEPEVERIDEWIGRMNLKGVTHVLVSHSHYDHSMDAPIFAEKTGAVLVGSQSTLYIGEGLGLDQEQMLEIGDRSTFETGKFRITFLESVHGPALFGRIPYPGTVEEPLVPPASAGKYKLGAAYSIVIEHPLGTILHHASAGSIPGMFDGVQADLVMLGIAGRETTEGYIKEVVEEVGAKRLLMTHFDDFFVSLDKPLEELWFVDFSEFLTTAEREFPHLSLETLPLGEERQILP